MGNVSLWTYSVILLYFGRFTFSQRCPYENPLRGYRNTPSKLNLRNFLGSKLIQKLADNYNNVPQYEPYEHQMFSPSTCEQMAPPPPPMPPIPPPPQGLPLPPLPPSFPRGITSYQYENTRIPVPAFPPPPLPQGMGPPQSFGPPTNEMSSPPLVMDIPPLAPPPPPYIGPPPPHAMDLPPRGMDSPPTQPFMSPPPPNAMEILPRGVDPSPPHMGQSSHENYYTETITSSCPCPSCGTCSECEAAQDYSYHDEPCSCCSDENCPCACEECPCSCRGKDCRGGRCPSYPSGDASYRAEKEYSDREQNYDEYPASDCPCCCECSGNQDCPCCCECSGNQNCPCAYADEPQGPSPNMRERPSYRGYSPPISENCMEGPPDAQVQRPSEGYVNMMSPPAFKPMPPPTELQQPKYSQYDEPMEPPPYVKLPPRRTFVPQPLPQAEIPQPVIQHPSISEFPEAPMHNFPQHHHMAESQERIMQHPHISEVPQRTVHHTEITEQTMHRYRDPGPPMQMQPVESYPMQQEMSRMNEWRPLPRMPPPGPPRHMMEEGGPHPEPPVPIYRGYHSLSNRSYRKYRKPSKPPFFEGLNYNDGC